MEYRAYFSVEPWPGDRFDFHMAKLMALITNMSGKSVKKDVKARDFLADWWRPVPKEDQFSKEQHIAQLRGDLRAWGASVNAKQGG